LCSWVVVFHFLWWMDGQPLGADRERREGIASVRRWVLKEAGLDFELSGC